MSNGASTTVTTLEDTPLPLSLTLTDVDAHVGLHTLTLTPSSGTVSLPPSLLSSLQLTTAPTTPGGDVLGTVARGAHGTITQLLASLTYTPPANANIHNIGVLTLTITVSDDVTTAGQDSQSDTLTLTIVITPVLDAPIVQLPLLPPLPSTILEDSPLPLPLLLSHIDAVDAPTSLLTLTCVTTGTSGGGLIAPTTTPYPGLAVARTTAPEATATSITGTLTALQTLTSSNDLLYTPLENAVGQLLLTCTLSTTATPPPDASVVTHAVEILPVNDPPLLTLASTPLTTPATTPLPLPTTVTLTDPDFLDPSLPQAATLTLAITPTVGSITITNDDLSYSFGTNGVPSAAMVITGTLTSLATALTTLVYTPVPHTHGVVPILLTVNDNGNTGTPLTHTTTLYVTVTSVNTPAVIVDDFVDKTGLGVPIVEGEAFAIGEYLEVVDVDAANDMLTVTVSVEVGVLSTVKPLHYYPVYCTQAADTAVTCTGTLSHVNKFLTAVVYASPIGKENKGTTVSVAVTVADGAATSAVTLPFLVTGKTHPLTFTLPSSIAAVEDVPLTLPAVVVTSTDLAETDAVTVTMTVDHGLLTLPSTTTDTMDVVVHEGTVDVPSDVLLVTVTLQDVDGLTAAITYTPSSDYTTDVNQAGVYSVTVTPVSNPDGGATRTTRVVVDGVVDLPTVTFAPSTTDEDIPVSVPVTVTSNDVVDGALYTVYISAETGGVYLPSVDKLYSSVKPFVSSSSLTLSGSFADINAAVNSLVYVPEKDWSGEGEIHLSVMDGAGTSSGAVVIPVTVTPINDPPVITLPTLTPGYEDAVYTFTEPIIVSDVDDNAVQVEITSLHCEVTLPPLPAGVTDTNNVLTGSIEDINALLADLTLTLDTNFNTPATHSHATLSLAVVDKLTGVTAVTATASLYVTPVNDAPIITLPSPVTVSPTTATAITTLTLSEVDSDTLPLTLTMTASSGTLTLATLVGLSSDLDYHRVSSSSITVRGSVTALNAALQPVTYTPTTVTDSDTFTITLSDEGNVGTPFTVLEASDTFNILYSDPVGAGTTLTAPSLTILEDEDAYFTTLTLTSATPAIPTTITIATQHSTISLPSAVNDVLIEDVADSPNGATYVSLTGLPADLNVLFQDLTLTLSPTPNYAGTLTLIYTTTTSSVTTTTTQSVTVTPVNDAPVITLPPPPTVSVATPFPLPALYVTDVDRTPCPTGTGLHSVTLHAPNGLLSLPPPTAGGLQITPPTAVTTGTNTITLRAPLTTLAPVLTTIAYTAAATGTDTLTLTVNDEGNCGGAPLTVTADLAIHVVANADPPVITTALTTPVTVIEDTPTVLPSISLSSSTTTLLKVHVTVTTGTLELSSLTALALQTAPTGATLTFTALPTAASAALAALLYTPALNVNAATSTTHIKVTITAGDDVTTATYLLLITPVNDTPTITAPASFTVTEDVATLLSGITVADVDGDEDDATSHTLTIICTTGTISYDVETARRRGVTATLEAESGVLALTSHGTTPLQNVLETVSYTTAVNDEGDSEILLHLNDGIASTSASVQVATLPVFTTPSITSISPDGSAIMLDEDTATTLPAFSLTSPNTLPSSTVSFEIKSAAGALFTLSTDEEITLQTTDPTQTITATSTVSPTAPSLPAIQIVRTAVPFVFETATFSFAHNQEIDLSYVGAGATHTVSLSTDPDTLSTDLSSVLQALPNLGPVAVTPLDTPLTLDVSYAVTFLSNDGDLPDLTTSNAAHFVTAETTKGTTVRERQRVSIYSPTALTAGTFQLMVPTVYYPDTSVDAVLSFMDDNYVTATLSFDESAADFQQHVNNLPNVKLAVVTAIEANKEMVYEGGGKFRTTWDVEFFAEQGNRPLLVAKWKENGGVGSTNQYKESECDTCTPFSDYFPGNPLKNSTQITVHAVAEGSDMYQSASKFALTYDGYSFESPATTALIPSDVSAAGMKAAIEALPNINRVSVERTSPTPENTLSWTITFDERYHRGDLPLLAVAETALVTNLGAVYVNRLNQGHAPLAGEYSLKLWDVPDAQPALITVPTTATSSDLQALVAPHLPSPYAIEVSSTTSETPVASAALSGTTYAAAYTVKITPAGPTLSLHSSSVTGTNAKVKLASSSALKTVYPITTHKVRTSASAFSDVVEIQDIICQSDNAAESFTLTFRGQTTAPISAGDYPRKDQVPLCTHNVTMPSGVPTPSPCRGDGSSLEEKLEQLTSISSVTILTSTNNTAVSYDSWSETSNPTVCASTDLTGTAFVNRITFVSTDDAVGDIEFIQITDKTGPGDTLYSKREHTRGSASFVNEVQTVATKATAADLDGTFTLSFLGEVTPSIAFDAEASTLKAALESLSSIFGLEVSRFANTDNGYTYSLTFLSDASLTPTHVGDMPLIESPTGCGTNDAEQCQLTGTNPSISVTEIVNGFGPMWGNFTLRLTDTDGATAQTTPILPHDCTSEQMQAALRSLSLGTNAVVALRTSNSNADFGYEWDVELNDGGSTLLAIADSALFDHHNNNLESITFCGAGGFCSASCSTSTSSTNHYGKFESSTRVQALCASPTPSSDLDDWCQSVLETTSTTTSCTTPSWAGCAACASYAAPRVEVQLSKSLLEGKGSLAAVNTALSALVYKPAANVHSAISGYDVVTVKIYDTKNHAEYTASNLEIPTATHTLLMDVAPVNDSPTISSPTTLKTTEDTELRISALSIDDVDLSHRYYASLPLTLTLTVSHGTLALATSTGLAFTTSSTSAPHAHSAITVTGSVSDLNAALSPLSYMPAADFNSLSHAGSSSEVHQITVSADKAKEVQRVAISALAGGEAGVVSGTFTLKMDCEAFGDQINFDGYASSVGLDVYSNQVQGLFETSNVITVGDDSSLDTELNALISACASNAQDAANDYIANTANTATSYEFAYDVSRLRAIVFDNPTDNTGAITMEVTFDGAFDNFPLLQVVTNSATSTVDAVSYPAAIDINNALTGENTIGGSYTLSGSEGTSIVSATASADDIKTAVAAVTSAAASELTVTRTILSTSQQTSAYQVTFKSLVGDVDSLQITDTASLTGTGVAASVAELVKVTANYDTLQIQVDDGGNIGDVNTPLSASHSTFIYVTPANDAPTVTVPASIFNMEEDTAKSFSNVFSVADADDATLVVTISTVRGTFSCDSTLDGVSISSSSDQVTVDSSHAVINALLDSLVYEPTADFNGVTDITCSAEDSSGNVAVGTVRVLVASVNDAPVVVAPTTILSSAGSTTTLTGITVSDADIEEAWDNTLVVQMSVSSGVLTIDNPNRKHLTTYVASGDGKSLDFKGTPAMLGLALVKLKYTSSTGFVGADALSVIVSDGVASTTKSVTLTVSADTNPAIEIAVPAGYKYGVPIVVLEDDTWSGGGIALSNIDSLLGVNDVIAVTVACSHGTLGNANTAFAAELQLRDTLSAVNAVLSSLVYSPAENWSGLDTLTIATGSTSAKIIFSVEPVNDAPTLSMTGASLLEVEEGATVAVGAFVIEDVDADECLGDSRCNGGLIKVTARVTGGASRGSLSIANAWIKHTALSLHSCDASTDSTKGFFDAICFHATPAMASKALSELEYMAAYSSHRHAHSIVVVVDDLGNWDGGLQVSKVASASFEVVVTVGTVHPHFVLSGRYFEFDEDESYHFFPSVVTDNDVADSLSVTVSASVGSFDLTHELPHGVAIEASTSTSITLTGTSAAISAAFSPHSFGFTYVPTSNYNGLDKIRFSTPYADNDVEVVVKVLAVNDAPVLSLVAASAITLDEGSTASLSSLVNLADVDAAESFGGTLDLTITSSVGAVAVAKTYFPGVWATSSDSGVLLRGGETSLSSALAFAGYLEYTPPSGYHGDGASITFVISDTGNSGSGGALSGSQTIDVFVTKIHNEPTVTIAPTRAEVVEDIGGLLGPVVTVLTPELGAHTKTTCSVSLIVGELNVNTSDDNDVSFELSTDVASFAGKSAVYVVEGPASAVSSSLSKLAYSPSTNYNGLDVVEISCSDGTVTSATATLNVIVTSVNDRPSTVLPVTSFTFAEDEVLSLSSGVGVFVIDPDAHEISGGMVVLSATVLNGDCKLILPEASKMGGLKASLSDDGKSLSLEGTVANVNVGIGGSSIQCAQDWVGSGSVSFLVSDNHGEADGGAQSASFVVTDVNDAPVVISSSDLLQASEDAVKDVAGWLSIYDPDATSTESLTLVLKVPSSAGGFMLNVEPSTLGVKIDAVNSQLLLGNEVYSEFSVSGTVVNLNAMLAADNTFFFVPFTDWYGSLLDTEGIEISVVDGDLASTTEYRALTVVGENDEPSIVQNEASIEAEEDVTLSLSGFFTITDSDLEFLPSGESPSLTVTISAASGSVGLASAIDGCYVQSGSGIALSPTLSFQGDQDVIEQAMAVLIYQTCVDCDTDDTLSITVFDHGNFGQNGVALSSTHSAAVSVTPVNDAPRSTQPVKFVTEGTDDELLKVTFEDFTVYDVDEKHTDRIEYTMTVLPTGSGTLTLVDRELGGAGVEFLVNDGVEDETVTFATTSTIANNIFSRVVLYRTSTASAAMVAVTATDILGAVHTTNIIPGVLFAANAAPTVSFGLSSGSLSQDEETTFNLDFVTVDDVDVDETPNSYLEVSLSSTDGGSLEVQTVTTNVVNKFPVYTIQTTADTALGGSFTVQIGTCTSASIYVDALSKTLYELSDSAVPGERSWESVESVLNAMTCLSDLGVTVEVYRDGAGSGQENADDGSNVNVGVSTNSDQDADAQGGHTWKIAFLGAATSSFPVITLASDASLTGTNKNVRVQETQPGNYLEGGFKLALGSQYFSTMIPFDASERQLGDALESMESVEAVKVSRSVNDVKTGSYVWTVTFLSMGEQHAGGDVPELQVYENTLADSVTSYPDLSCDVSVNTVADGVGKPAVWQLQTMVGVVKNPVHVVALQGVGVQGDFALSLVGYGTTGLIHYDTVPMIADEIVYAVPDFGQDNGGSTPHGTRVGESIEALINALPNWDSSSMSVEATKSVTNGGQDVEWRITYIGVDYALPTATISAGTAAATSAFVNSVTLGLAGNGVGGTFEVKFLEEGVKEAGEVYSSGTLNSAINEADMKSALTSMLNDMNDITSDVDLEVSRAGPDLHGGFTWTVALLRSPAKFYSSVNNLGGVGEFVIDGFSLTGVGATARTKLVRSGGERATLNLSSAASLGGIYFPKTERRGAADGAGTSTFTMRGSLASLNAALEHLTLTAPTEFHGDIYLEVEVDDQGFSGSGGSKSAHESFKVTINDVANEPEVRYGGVTLWDDETALAAEEDTVVKFNQQTTFLASRGLADFNVDSNLVFSIDHSDAGVDNVVVVVSAANGVVSVETDYGFPLGLRSDITLKEGHSGDEKTFSIEVHGNGQTGTSVTLEGPLSIVNTALESLSYKGGENWFGDDILTVQVESQGQTKVRNVYLNVAAVNDYPVVVIEGEVVNVGQLTQDPTSWTEIVFDATEDEVFNVDFVSLFDVDNLDLYKSAEGDAYELEKQQVLEVELVVSNGVLSLREDHRGGLEVTSSNGGRNLLLRGLQLSLNEGLKKVKYLNDLNWNGDDVLIITATDFGVYTYSARMPLYHVRNVVVRVNAVNDIPYVVFPTGEGDASVLVALEDVGGVIGSDLATVDDLDLDIRFSVVNNGKPVHYLSSAPIRIVDDDVAAAGEITLEVSVAFGSLTLRNLPTVAGVLTFELGDGVLDKELRVKGKIGDLNTALDGAVYLSDLNFNSEFGHIFPAGGYDNGMEQIVVRVSDESGGTSESVLSVDVLAMNDAPVLMTGHDVLDATLTFGDDLSQLRTGVNTLFVKEDVAHKMVGVSVRDVDCKQSLVEGLVQVTAYSSNGAVSVPANSPVQQYVSGSGGVLNKMLIFTGSVKNVNVALSDLVYASDVDYYGADQLILTVNDLGNYGYAFEYNSTSKLTELEASVQYSDSVTIPIVVSSEVDAPVINLPNEGSSEFMTFTEDMPGNLVGVSISDVDGSSGDVEVEIYCSKGRVKLNTLEGLAFSVGNGILDQHVKGTGSLFNWNRAISDMTYLPDAQWHTNMRELDEVVVTVSDLGLEDAEGDIGVSSKTLYVEVLAVNDAPEWRVPGLVWRLPSLANGKQRGYVVDYVETSVIDEDEDLIFENSIYIIDHDLTEADRSDLDSVVLVEVDCGFCTLVLDGPKAGLQWLVGSNGEKTMRFQGTLKNVNNALSRLVYRAEVDYNGADAINFYVSDLGNFGEGAVVALDASITIPVTVDPVNDSPKWSTPDYPVACPEDKLCKISNVQIVDPDAAEGFYSGIFDVTVEADFGSVTMNGIEVPASIAFNWGDDGEGSRKVRMSGTMADINFMLNDLVYSPMEDMTTLNGRGNEVIHLLVSSDGGSPGLTAEGRVMLVIAEGNNDAPIIQYSGATYSGNDEGCQDDDHDYSNDSTMGVLGRNQSSAPGHSKCHRLLSVDVLECVEDIACSVDGLYVIDADAVEMDYHAVEVTLESTNGNLVMPDATRYDIWWDTVAGSGVGGAWPKEGVAIEISSNQHMMKMRGRLDVVNDALSSLYYVSDPHFFGTDKIEITVNDLGFWGSGGPQETKMTIPIYVDAEEDKPLVQFDRSLLFASGGDVVSATEDEFFKVNGVSIVHADSNPTAAIAYVAGLKKIAPTFDGSNVPSVEGSGFIRVMIEASNLRFRLSNDERLMFTVPNITSEEIRRYDNMYYGSGEQLEVEKRSSDGVDLGLVSGAPEILWWNNVTIEGRLVDVNNALDALTVLGNSNFCSDADCLYDQKLAWVRFNVKSLGEIGDGDVNSEARVTSYHWDYDDSKMVYVKVGGVNDLPVVTIGGDLEEYTHESTNLIEGDGLSRIVTAINWLYGNEEESISVPVSFRDVDDAEITVNVAATFGHVSLEDSESLFFSKGTGEYDVELEVTGSVDDLNSVFESLKFSGMADYFGDGGSVTFTASDGSGGTKAARTIMISLRSVNDPIEMLLGVDTEDFNITYFVDEGEAVRLGGATLVPDRFEALSIGVRSDKGYSTKTGFELWRSEGEKGSFDKMGDWTQGNYQNDGWVSWGWGENEQWRGNLVKDIGAGELSSTPRYFEEYNGLLYFSAENGVSGRELWRTDGTTGGTVQVKDIFPGKRSSDPTYLTEFNGYLYFSADGVDDTWMINHEHADECGGFRQDSMNPKVFYAVAETNVWETEKEYDCPFGYHWASTGEAFELFKSANNYGPGVVGESRGYEGKCGWKGYEWGGLTRQRFRFSDSRLTGAYKHAGKWDSVRPDIDSAVGGVGLVAQPADLVASDFAGVVCVAGEPKGDETIFYDECRKDADIYDSSMDASCWARGGRELWRTDGTAEGTKRIGDMRGGGSDAGVGGVIKAGMRGSDPRFFTVVGADMFFSAESDGEHGGRELWKTDGSETGASQVKDINDHIKASDPTDLIECGGVLYFSAIEQSSGRELWKSDGTSGGTVLVKDVRAGVEGSGVNGLVCNGGVIYFAADDGANGEELWKSDGSGGGTVLVKDLFSGSEGSSPKYLVVWSGEVYFSADDGVSGAELWKSDGTSSGTVLVDDVWVGSGNSYPSFMTVFTSKAPGATSKLFFLGNDGKHSGGSGGYSPNRVDGWGSKNNGVQMYVYDGVSVERAFTQTFSNVDIDWVGMDADFPADFGVFENTLYYGANFGKRDKLVPQGFVDREQFSSYYRDFGFDQAWVLWDDDADLEGDRIYSGFVTVTKGEVEVVGVGRGVSVEFNGTLAEVNMLARKVVYYPDDGEQGWADVVVEMVDLVGLQDCEERDVCEEMVVRGGRKIWITGVNDAPVITRLGAGGGVEGKVGEEVVVEGVTVADEDLAEGGLMRVTVEVTQGRVGIRGRDGISVEGEGRGDGWEKKVEWYAELGSVNEALKELKYVCGVEDGCMEGDVDQIVVIVNDNGGSGKGGAKGDELVVQVVIVGE